MGASEHHTHLATPIRPPNVLCAPWHPKGHQANSMLARPVRLRSPLAHATRGATDLGHTGGKQPRHSLSAWIRPALQSACFRRNRDPLHGTAHRGMVRSVSLRTQIERCAGGRRTALVMHQRGGETLWHLGRSRGDGSPLGRGNGTEPAKFRGWALRLVISR